MEDSTFLDRGWKGFYTTVYHGFFLFLLYTMIAFSVIGANDFQSKIDGITNQRIFQILYIIACGLLPLYIICEWINDMMNIFLRDIRMALQYIYTKGEIFISGGVKELQKKKDQTL